MHDLALPSSGDASGAGDACLFGLSLCSGAGGLDLGLAIALPGYRTVGHVERETFAAATLVARMEDASVDHAPVWDDVGTFDGRSWRGAVDIVTAGYPCQPFSVAGKRRGADDPRHLWPHVARIIGEVEPPFVFLENVAHHLRLGFPEVASGLVRMALSVQQGLGRDPHAGEIFCFRGRKGDLVKLLWHDGVGMSLYLKRLEAGKFIWPVSQDGTAVAISSAQLGYLLEGIDWRNPRWTQRPKTAG